MIRKSIFLNMMNFVLGASLLTMSTEVVAEQLDLSEGTMTTAGIATVNYQSNSIGIHSANNWNAGLQFDFGYFVIDNLGLIFDVGAKSKFTAVDTGRSFQLGINLMYAFDTGGIVRPYILVGGFGAWGNGVGVVARPELDQPVRAPAPGWSAGVKPAVGLLVGLNQHVALDFGIMATIDFPIAATAGNIAINAGVGYLGVRGFF